VREESPTGAGRRAGAHIIGRRPGEGPRHPGRQPAVGRCERAKKSPGPWGLGL